MKLLYGFLVLICAVSLNNAVTDTTLKLIETDKLLMDHLMRATAENPSYALECFELYIPIFEAIIEQFSTSYKLCVTTANDESSELDTEAIANQTSIVASTQDVCTSIIDCSSLESLAFFDCYALQAGTNVKTMYTLKNTAIDVAAYLREEYHVIDYNMEKCKNSSERAYVESTASSSEALNYCLTYGPPEIVAITSAAVNEATLIDSTTVAPVATITEAVQPEAAVEVEDLSKSSPLVSLLKDKISTVGG